MSSRRSSGRSSARRSLNPLTLDGKSVRELRDLLDERGLGNDGSKVTLVQRLQDWIYAADEKGETTLPTNPTLSSPKPSVAATTSQPPSATPKPPSTTSETTPKTTPTTPKTTTPSTTTPRTTRMSTLLSASSPAAGSSNQSLAAVSKKEDSVAGAWAAALTAFSEAADSEDAPLVMSTDYEQSFLRWKHTHAPDVGSSLVPLATKDQVEEPKSSEAKSFSTTPGSKTIIKAPASKKAKSTAAVVVSAVQKPPKKVPSPSEGFESKSDDKKSAEVPKSKEKQDHTPTKQAADAVETVRTPKESQNTKKTVPKEKSAQPVVTNPPVKSSRDEVKEIGNDPKSDSTSGQVDKEWQEADKMDTSPPVSPVENEGVEEGNKNRPRSARIRSRLSVIEAAKELERAEAEWVDAEIEKLEEEKKGKGSPSVEEEKAKDEDKSNSGKATKKNDDKDWVDNSSGAAPASITTEKQSQETPVSCKTTPIPDDPADAVPPPMKKKKKKRDRTESETKAAAAVRKNQSKAGKLKNTTDGDIQIIHETIAGDHQKRRSNKSMTPNSEHGSTNSSKSSLQSTTTTTVQKSRSTDALTTPAGKKNKGPKVIVGPRASEITIQTPKPSGLLDDPHNLFRPKGTYTILPKALQKKPSLLSPTKKKSAAASAAAPSSSTVGDHRSSVKPSNPSSTSSNAAAAEAGGSTEKTSAAGGSTNQKQQGDKKKDSFAALPDFLKDIQVQTPKMPTFRKSVDGGSGSGSGTAAGSKSGGSFPSTSSVLAHKSPLTAPPKSTASSAKDGGQGGGGKDPRERARLLAAQSLQQQQQPTAHHHGHKSRLDAPGPQQQHLGYNLPPPGLVTLVPAGQQQQQPPPPPPPPPPSSLQQQQSQLPLGIPPGLSPELAHHFSKMTPQLQAQMLAMMSQTAANASSNLDVVGAQMAALSTDSKGRRALKDLERQQKRHKSDDESSSSTPSSSSSTDRSNATDKRRSSTKHHRRSSTKRYHRSGRKSHRHHRRPSSRRDYKRNRHRRDHRSSRSSSSDGSSRSRRSSRSSSSRSRSRSSSSSTSSGKSEKKRSSKSRPSQQQQPKQSRSHSKRISDSDIEEIMSPSHQTGGVNEDVPLLDIPLPPGEPGKSDKNSLPLLTECQESIQTPENQQSAADQQPPSVLDRSSDKSVIELVSDDEEDEEEQKEAAENPATVEATPNATQEEKPSTDHDDQSKSGSPTVPSSTEDPPTTKSSAAEHPSAPKPSSKEIPTTSKPSPTEHPSTAKPSFTEQSATDSQNEGPHLVDSSNWVDNNAAEEATHSDSSNQPRESTSSKVDASKTMSNQTEAPSTNNDLLSDKTSSSEIKNTTYVSTTAERAPQTPIHNAQSVHNQSGQVAIVSDKSKPIVSDESEQRSVNASPADQSAISSSLLSLSDGPPKNQSDQSGTDQSVKEEGNNIAESTQAETRETVEADVQSASLIAIASSSSNSSTVLAVSASSSSAVSSTDTPASSSWRSELEMPEKEIKREPVDIGGETSSAADEHQQQSDQLQHQQHQQEKIGWTSFSKSAAFTSCPPIPHNESSQDSTTMNADDEDESLKSPTKRRSLLLKEELQRQLKQAEGRGASGADEEYCPEPITLNDDDGNDGSGAGGGAGNGNNILPPTYEPMAIKAEVDEEEDEIVDDEEEMDDDVAEDDDDDDDEDDDDDDDENEGEKVVIKEEPADEEGDNAVEDEDPENPAAAVDGGDTAAENADPQANEALETEKVDGFVYVKGRTAGEDVQETEQDNDQVQMDSYNADLSMGILTESRTTGEPLTQEGFALIWSGVRANYGVRHGRIAFQVKLADMIDVSHLTQEESVAHDLRIGWSKMDSPLQLGESPQSFGFCSIAKKAENSVFMEWSDGFHKDDIITCMIDFETREISYQKGKEPLGVAFTFEKVDGADGAAAGDDPPTVFFPHIATKNCRFNVNFGQEKESFGIDLPEGYEFINDVDRSLLVRNRTAVKSKKDCTVLMMVGLPGCGKTRWINEYLRDNSEEQWEVISADTVLDMMKVNGVARHKVHQGRWDVVMGLVAKAVNKMLQLACRKRKNYIIDQTNVMWGSRKRKMIMFNEFGGRKAVIIIPNEEDFANRRSRQTFETGREMPTEAMLEMKAQFSLPIPEDGLFDEIIFVEPEGGAAEAAKVVEKYNEEGEAWKPPVLNRKRGSAAGGYPFAGAPPKRAKINRLAQGSATQKSKANAKAPPNYSMLARSAPISRQYRAKRRQQRQQEQSESAENHPPSTTSAESLTSPTNPSAASNEPSGTVLNPPSEATAALSVETVAPSTTIPLHPIAGTSGRPTDDTPSSSDLSSSAPQIPPEISTPSGGGQEPPLTEDTARLEAALAQTDAVLNNNDGQKNRDP